MPPDNEARGRNNRAPFFHTPIPPDVPDTMTRQTAFMTRRSYLAFGSPGALSHALSRKGEADLVVAGIDPAEAVEQLRSDGWRTTSLSGFVEPEGFERFTKDARHADLLRLPGREALKVLEGAFTDIVPGCLQAANTLRRFAAPGARVHDVDKDGNGIVPPFLVPDGDVFRYRGDEAEAAVRTPEDDRVVVVGAGLGGALCAQALHERGFRVTIVDAFATPGAGASALYAGLVHPHWQKTDSPLFTLTRMGYDVMLGLLERFPGCIERRGVLDIAPDDETYVQWSEAVAEGHPYAFPSGYLRLVGREEAAMLSGYALKRGGWYFGGSGLVFCSRFVRSLVESSRATVHVMTPVRLERRDGLWRALDRNGTCVAEAPRALVCAAYGTAGVLGLEPEDLGLSVLHGRISLLPEGSLEGDVPTTGRGYLMRSEGFDAVGATYEPEGERMGPEEAHEHNLGVFPALFGEERRIARGGFYEGGRAVAKDRMPLLGRGFLKETLSGLEFRGRPEMKDIPREEGLVVCTGFGSRGLTWGAALAEAAADMAAGRPARLTRSMAKSLDPARFLYGR